MISDGEYGFGVRASLALGVLLGAIVYRYAGWIGIVVSVTTVVVTALMLVLTEGES